MSGARCRMCGATENLTKHHLLNRKVRLCQSCHARFHSGPAESRQAAWDELTPLLTDVDLEPALVPTDPRRAKIESLAQHGATQGEREAATSALRRLDHPSEQTHAATERGSYYARDTLGGTDE